MFSAKHTVQVHDGLSNAIEIKLKRSLNRINWFKTDPLYPESIFTDRIANGYTFLFFFG